MKCLTPHYMTWCCFPTSCQILIPQITPHQVDPTIWVSPVHFCLVFILLGSLLYLTNIYWATILGQVNLQCTIKRNLNIRPEDNFILFYYSWKNEKNLHTRDLTNTKCEAANTLREGCKIPIRRRHGIYVGTHSAIR